MLSFNQILLLYQIAFAIFHHVVTQDTGNTTDDSIENNPLWKTYSQCKPHLGSKILTCDPDNVLRTYGVRMQIDEILWLMQTDVPCYCPFAEDCMRYNGVPIQSGVIAVLIAFKGGDLPDNITEISQRIYTQSNLSISETNALNESSTCDNGLLLIYAIDTRTLFLFPGTAVNSIFNHLPTHRRRIEPYALPEYLSNMLTILKDMPPAGMNLLHVHPWGGWELIVGMVVAVLIVALAGAVLVAICVTRWFGGVRQVRSPYMDAFMNYERECKEWTKRTRRLAKKRNKLMCAMQKPNWSKKVQAAKNRLSEKRTSSTGAILESCNSSEFGDYQQNAPYYIVTEPNAHVYPNAAFDEASIHGPTGTVRVDYMMGANGRRQRETQRRDFYFTE